MTYTTNLKNCTGCQACRLICPNRCIEIRQDDEGFQVPHVDETRCTDCGQCALRCPANNRPEFANNELPYRVIGARLKKDELLSNSASGGVFAGIAMKILETPGNAVFGCAFDDDIVARHTCVTDTGNLAPLQSSKYVQSDVRDTYTETKTLLDNGKTVFYTGTPCQIAGLYAYLGKNYDNLLTADLICHGVPSPLLFKRYIERLGRKFGGKIIYYNFRSKEKYGWSLMTKTKTKTKTKTIIPSIDPYYHTFLANITHRECCYSCQYANTQRIADITLGDFWGVENIHPKFFDRRGVSVVLVNTLKGEEYFKEVLDCFEIVESTLDKISLYQDNLKTPSLRPKMRDIVYNNVNDEEIDIFRADCFKHSTSAGAKALVKKILPDEMIIILQNLKRKVSKQ